METYAQAREKDRSNAEIMGHKRQEKALREFKQVLEDLVFLLRSASGMETVYMYWVNRSREQFVMETKSTCLTNVMFQDRISFDEHFLEKYKDISEPLTVEIGNELSADELSHYYNDTPVQYITVLPFTNNGETVAITVLESSEHIFSDDKSEIVYSYIDALRNVLNTYLEISDLYERQEEWIDYEQSLSVLNTRSHRAELIKRMINTMQGFLHHGGVSFVSQGMGGWANVMNSENANWAPPIGMPLEERTLAHEALEKGSPEFSIHFNNNPKRLSPREHHTEGASLAIPMLMDDRRQGLVLVYDENPLVFKESTKHKLINFVRTTGLKIMANESKLDVDENLLTNDYGAFLPDVWERMVDAELKRKRQELTRYHSWLGLITLADLPSIRTKLRLEELHQMQKDLIKAFNPSQFGVPGIIGFHSDYVYTFFLQSKDEKAIEHWTKSLKQQFSEPFELTNRKQINGNIKVGFTHLDPDISDSYQAVSNAKSALSKAMKGASKASGIENG
ncbi:MAG: GAF domain-containing protein [Balneolaceae bacterium]|nr:GAF domain-containing protein [Balneolaceae bacterium]